MMILLMFAYKMDFGHLAAAIILPQLCLLVTFPCILHRWYLQWVIGIHVATMVSLAFYYL